MPATDRESAILERLRAVCAHAYEYALFYRRKCDQAGFHPSHLKSLEDFEMKVPVVQKKDRGARNAGHALLRFLKAIGAFYLDTQESRGLVPADHPSFAGAVRAAVMSNADAVIVIGRKLDHQLGYGSPTVFPKAASSA